MSFPFTSFVAMEGMVFKANAIVDTMTKDIEITATTCENNVTRSKTKFTFPQSQKNFQPIWAAGKKVQFLTYNSQPIG